MAHDKNNPQENTKSEIESKNEPVIVSDDSIQSDTTRHIETQIETVITRMESYESSILHPEHLKAYAEIDPSFPNKIFEMVEIETKHDHEMDNELLRQQAEFHRENF